MEYKFYTIKEYAEMLHISTRTAYRQIEEKTLKTIRAGIVDFYGKYRIPESEIKRMLIEAGINTDKMPTKFYTSKEVAEMLHISHRTLDRRIQAKTIRGIKTSGKRAGGLRIPDTEIERIMIEAGIDPDPQTDKGVN